ncbi:MAG: methyltransferase [Sphingomonadaceae bacterium]
MAVIEPQSRAVGPPRWKLRWIGWRNRILADPAFQRWAAAMPFLRSVARRRAVGLFDLVAGFTYTQTLLATVESGLLDLLARGPCPTGAIGQVAGLSDAAAVRLVRAAAALDLTEEIAPGWWALGQQGAALHSNQGARAMILHHKVLYGDLADPLALLRQDRAVPTALSAFWRYAANARPDGESCESVEAYSRLMADSQRMVAAEALATYPFARHRALLDIGGGHGVFLESVGQACPDLRLGLFDLPGVLAGAGSRLDHAGLLARTSLHPGNFFRDPLPSGFDCISLVRILHDHDDGPALDLLRAIRAALPREGRLVIAEPMAGTPGAEAMGDAYFGLYLWAMRSGRPRRADEIGAMLADAGFARWTRLVPHQPVVTSLIVASP